MNVSLLLLAFSVSLVGPAHFYHSSSIWVIFTGLGLMGFAVAGLFIPVVPELIKHVGAVLEIKPTPADPEKLLEPENDPLRLNATEEQTLMTASKVEEAQPEQENLKKELADKASSLQSLFWAIGAFLSPIISGALYDSKGFIFTTDCMAAVVLVFACVYFGVMFAYPWLIRRRSKKQGD